VNYCASVYSKTKSAAINIAIHNIRNTAEGSTITIQLLMMFVYSVIPQCKIKKYFTTLECNRQ